MADISAKQVMQLRNETGLPMMECKKALTDAGGDHEAAKRLLREQGAKVQAIRSDRATTEGRIAAHLSDDPAAGAMIELQCESAPVASNDDFVQLAGDLARRLAESPAVTSPEELIAMESPSRSGVTMAEVKDDLFNRIREVFNLSRIIRFEGTCASYVHHTHKDAALLQYEGGDAELAKQICMHITARRPAALAKEELDPAEVERERELQIDVARKEGKPENIIEKMIEGRMRQFFAEHALLEQPFVIDEKKTIGQVAKEAGMKLNRMAYWQLGKP